MTTSTPLLSRRLALGALAGSALLTAQRRQYGEAWLRNLVKVHVSITNIGTNITSSTSATKTAAPMAALASRPRRRLPAGGVTARSWAEVSRIMSGSMARSGK